MNAPTRPTAGPIDILAHEREARRLRAEAMAAFIAAAYRALRSLFRPPMRGTRAA
jgi:hypothetical protein